MDLIVSNQLVKEDLSDLMVDYESEKEAIEKYSRFATINGGVFQYFLTGSKTNLFTAKDIFESEPAIKALDSAYWTKVINCTDVLQCMPAEKRNEWSEMIRALKTPSFEFDTVKNTIERLLLSRGTFMAEKADGIFKRLSGEHITNSPSGFKKKMIIDWVLSVNTNYRSVNHDRCEYIYDLRYIIAQMLGRDISNMESMYRIICSMERNDEFGKWVEFDGGAFKIKLFKKGTVHIEIHPEIAMKLNQLLHKLHPMAIPPQHREVKKKTKEHSVIKECVSFETIRGLSKVLENYPRGDDTEYTFYFNFSEKSEVTKVITSIGGVIHDRYVTFNFDARPVLSQIIRSGVVPDIKTHQYYPTPDAVVKKVHEIADIGIDEEVLEPSAGQGSLLEKCSGITDNIECVEIDEMNCKILEAKGYQAQCKDFLKYKTAFRFDKIIMNPPFSDGRAMAHVLHALKFLHDDGTLVAIVPSNFKSDIKGYTVDEFELDVNSFKESGTNVNTKIIKLMKE